jgi:hypothetical protein
MREGDNIRVSTAVTHGLTTNIKTLHWGGEVFIRAGEDPVGVAFYCDPVNPAGDPSNPGAGLNGGSFIIFTKTLTVAELN